MIIQPRTLLNKVPEVTVAFWVIKILCTTVGETAADYLNGALGWGLTCTSLAMTALLIAALAVQFRLSRYIPPAHWIAVVLLSIVGTLITDNLTDNFGVTLVTTTVLFGLVLIAVFSAWYAVEKTLSIHSIVTVRREAFYWLAILFTFALGTAAGDLAAERLGLGYGTSAGVFASIIAAIAIAYYAYYGASATGARGEAGAVLAFWLAYILTRPLGASIGDLLSQARADGGLGLGATGTSALFLAVILTVIVYLTRTGADQPREAVILPALRDNPRRAAPATRAAEHLTDL